MENNSSPLKNSKGRVKETMKVNLELSEKFFNKNFLNSSLNLSFQNSLIAFTQQEELKAGKYIEGYVVLNYGILSTKGWIELKGEIVDVTYLDGIIEYFPCDYYDLNKAKELWKSLKYKTPLYLLSELNPYFLPAGFSSWKFGYLDAHSYISENSKLRLELDVKEYKESKKKKED